MLLVLVLLAQVVNPPAPGTDAPDDAEYVTSSTDSGLTAERVLTDGTHTTVDVGTPGVITVNLTGIPDCNLDTETLNYDVPTLTWSCGDDDVGAGGSTPTGTGFRYVTAGVEDAAAHAIVDADVPNTITIDLAAAASALAADPANCVSATEFAVGVTAAGAATCEAIADADVPNTITVDLATLATTATTANAGDSATAFFSAGAIEIARGGTGQGTAVAAYDALSPNTTQGDMSYHDGTDNVRLAKGTAAQVLTMNGGATAPSWVTPTGASPFTTLVSTGAPTDAVIATYTAIPSITFTPAAATRYKIACDIIYTSSATTTGINFAWDVPAAVNFIFMVGYTTTVATGANEGFIQRADNVGTATSASIITVQNLAHLETIFSNGANTTATTLGFTPETANSVAVIAGSVCQYWIY